MIVFAAYICQKAKEMYDKLKAYCQNIISLSDDELMLIDKYFEVKQLNKKELLL